MSLVSAGQDTLPKFSVTNKGNNRIIVSWTNPYGQSIRQLSIQRSFDSLKNYKSILTVPDPTPIQNGYVDSKATNDHMFYRLYIQLDSGKYLFSVAKRPAPDTAKMSWTGQPLGDNQLDVQEIEQLKRELKKSGNERVLIIKKGNNLVGVVAESGLRRFRDSINYYSADTIVLKSDTVIIKPFIAKDFFKPSRYVFTERDGNIKIFLPEAASRKYALRFFEEDNSEVFEIKQIRDPVLLVDKANFIHSGWFVFELYEDGRLMEKHKVFVPKDF
ncbi:MAG: hypothetical protein WKF97_25890 [Chitinophagaceae bacterium]